MTQLRRSFTLIEVLIAIALALVLGGTMFVFLQDVLATRGRTLEHAARQRAAATLIERIEGDLSACLVGDVRHGAGIAGDAVHLRILTRGVLTQLASRGVDDPAALGDLHSVEYQFNAGNHSLEARKHLASESSDFAPLGGSIAHMRFRYLVGRQWQESFDSLAANQLPRAVEVCVWFNPWPGDDADSSTAEDEPATQPGDGSGNFNDDAFAAKSESESFRPPPPDRRRVIVIADGGEEEAANGQ